MIAHLPQSPRLVGPLSRLAAAALFLLPLLSRADWENYRGPNHNGISADKLPVFAPGEELKQLWTAKVGTGTSSMTVSGDRVFTMGNAAEKDTVWCFDAKTGKTLWKYEYPLALAARNFEGGTASTPHGGWEPRLYRQPSGRSLLSQCDQWEEGLV